MSDLPNNNEQSLIRCRALYLGTCLYKSDAKRSSSAINEILKLSQLQGSIASRYPTDGSNYAKGIETWLSIYPSGLQMEHASSADLQTISGLFFYPIKSLMYCGALRLVRATEQTSKFMPLDSDEASMDENLKNPPLYVAVLKAVDSHTRKEVVECHVFVVGLKTTAMKLVESCQRAFGASGALSAIQACFSFYKELAITLIFDHSNRTGKTIHSSMKRHVWLDELVLVNENDCCCYRWTR
jgi:hypothetical protein